LQVDRSVEVLPFQIPPSTIGQSSRKRGLPFRFGCLAGGLPSILSFFAQWFQGDDRDRRDQAPCSGLTASGARRSAQFERPRAHTWPRAPARSKKFEKIRILEILPLRPIACAWTFSLPRPAEPPEAKFQGFDCRAPPCRSRTRPKTYFGPEFWLSGPESRGRLRRRLGASNLGENLWASSVDLGISPFFAGPAPVATAAEPAMEVVALQFRSSASNRKQAFRIKVHRIRPSWLPRRPERAASRCSAVGHDL